jgi:Xaa-Pro aminopeptidase
MSQLPFHPADPARTSAKPFTDKEFRDRLAATQEAMRAAGLDCLLVHTPENIYYLTGYETSGYFEYQVLVVPPAGDPVLLVRNVERLNIDEYSWLPGGYTWTDGDDFLDRTARLVETLDAGPRVGLEKHSWFVTAHVAEELARCLGSRDLVDAGRLVERLRLVKSPAELTYVEEAARLADVAMAAALAAAKDGASELDVAAAAHAEQIRQGGEYPALPHYVSSGERTELGHAHWSTRVVHAGDTMKLEFLGVHRRYHAGLTRVVGIGTPDPLLERDVALCVSLQDETFASLRPGESAGEITRRTQEAMAATGRAGIRLRLGYSMGIGFPPIAGEGQTCDFRESATWNLVPGMVFHMLSVLSVGRVISDTVLITPEGCRRLTATPRRLFVA